MKALGQACFGVGQEPQNIRGALLDAFVVTALREKSLDEGAEIGENLADGTAPVLGDGKKGIFEGISVLGGDQHGQEIAIAQATKKLFKDLV